MRAQDRTKAPHRAGSVALATLILLAAVASAGCARSTPATRGSTARSTTAEATPALRPRRVTTQRVKVSGVIGRYPVATQKPGFFKSVWAIYSDLGSESRRPKIQFTLEPTRAPDATSAPSLEAFDGKVALIEGFRLVEDRSGYIGPGWIDPLLAYPVQVTSIVEGKPSASLRPPTTASLVQPGEWFKDEHRLRIWRALGRIKDPGTRAFSRVEEETGSRVRLPSSRLVGRLMGTWTDPRTSKGRASPPFSFGSSTIPASQSKRTTGGPSPSGAASGSSTERGATPPSPNASST